jgi:hypothetical protein
MRGLLSALVPVYAALVPLIIVPVGDDRFGLCEPLLCLSAVGLCLAAPFARPQIVHLAFGLFLLATLLSLTQISDPALLAGSALRWVRLLSVGIPLYFSRVLPPVPHVQRALRAFRWGGAAAIVCGLVIYWLQIPVNSQSQQFWLGYGHAPVLRASGLIGDTAAFGHLISVWGLVALGTLWMETPAYRLWKCGFVLAVVIYADLVTSSRAALLDTAAGLLVFSSLTAARRQTHRNVAVAIVCASVAGTALLVGISQSGWQSGAGDGVLNNSIGRFVGFGSASLDTFSSGRVDGWTELVPEMAEHPLVGTGYKTTKYLWPGRFSDNVFVGTALESGLIGLTSLLLVLCAIFHGLFMRHRVGNRDATLLLAVWVGQVLHGLTADTFTLWSIMPMLFLVTGLVLQMPAATVELPSNMASQVPLTTGSSR